MGVVDVKLLEIDGLTVNVVLAGKKEREGDKLRDWQD